MDVESCGSGVFNMGAVVGGDLTLTGCSYDSVGGNTAGGSTVVTVAGDEAKMTVTLPSGTFTDSSEFTIANLGALPPEGGTGPTGGTAVIDPVAAYQFTFGVPTLNQSASLSFVVDLNALDGPTRDAILQALSAGSVTLATKGDAAGSAYQAFPICTAVETPTVDGCVRIETLDSAGLPTAATPSSLRFSNVVGHFSTWAVAIVTPSGPPPSPCPRPQGYWKNNPNAWPVGSLLLGRQAYAKAELLAFLNTAAGSGKNADASLVLAYQLIAAKLNVANGSDPATVSGAIATADSLLSAYSGKLPYRVKPSSAAGQNMVNTAAVLESYNNAVLTPACRPQQISGVPVKQETVR